MTCALLALLALGQVSPHLLVFGGGRRWVILDGNGGLVRTIRDFPPGIPNDVRDLAITADGARVAVTAYLPSAQNVMLFLWDTKTGAAQQIGDAVGFHAAPSFSADGMKLVFAHHPKKGGPPGQHEGGSYAQLWEQHLLTLEMKALTSSSGCHMESSRVGERIYFSHADCRGGRRIEVLQSGREQPLTQFEDHHGEPSLSLDARRLVFTHGEGDEIELQELSLTSARPLQPKTIWHGARLGSRLRPQYIQDGRVAFQNGENIYIATRGVAEPKFSLDGATQ